MRFGPRKSACPECSGTKHRWDEAKGAWVSCSCLKSRRTASRYEKAGIGVKASDETWRTFFDSYAMTSAKGLLGSAALMKAGDLPDEWWILHGRPGRARRIASALVLKAACDGGLSAGKTDLATLIDIEFERSEDQDADLWRRDVLSLELGDEPRHKWNRQVLDKILKARTAMRRFTILVTELEPSRLPSYYSSPVLEETLSEMARAKVEPK